MTAHEWDGVQLDLSAALMDSVEDLRPGSEIRIIRDAGGCVHVQAPDARLQKALRRAFEAERAPAAPGVLT